ncbi:MAG: 4Fe-4S dicluster domain-containing protein [Oscillospiraceae bacterium]|nr:4Fe-4S dicluster domain-containing protein [Oscillospiraceae bacterium]
MDLSVLKDSLFSQAQDMGANLCGIADLTDCTPWIRENYGDLCASFPRAVSISIFFPREIIAEQAVGPTRSYSYFYAAINRQLDSIGFRISNVLQQNGFRAYPVPTSDYRQTHLVPGLQEAVAAGGTGSLPKMQTELMGMFSHRFAASHAGLGWIGKSCHVINPQVGPRLRLTTVLTDALLPPDQPIPNRCGGCTRCRDACPTHAIRGVSFRPEDPPSARIDKDTCYNFLEDLAVVFGQHTCAKCLAACPWGSK